MNTGQLSFLKNLIENQHADFDSSYYHGKKILVSGSSGHIGIWVTLLLSSCNSSLDNFDLTIETQRYIEISKLHLDLNLKKPKQFEDDGKSTFDIIFDLRLPKMDVNDSKNYEPISEFLKLFIRQKKMLRQSGALVIPSSGAVYDRNKIAVSGFKEDDANKTESRSIYGHAKYLIEKLSQESSDFQMPIFRIFSVFGPLMRNDSMLIGNNFFKQASKSRKILLSGNGQAARNMTFVGDIARQILTITQKGNSLTGPINLGSQNNLTVLEFAKYVAKVYKAEVLVGEKDDSSDNYLPDLSKLKTLINDTCLTVEEAVDATSRFYPND